MLNENAKRWVAALRSGEYKQVCSYLRTSDGFCCMGVACDIYAKETGRGKWEPRNDWQEFQLDSDELALTSETELPHQVRRWLGLQECGGKYVNPAHPTTLWYLISDNDGDPFVDSHPGNLDFAAIADIIESEPEGLFVK